MVLLMIPCLARPPIESSEGPVGGISPRAGNEDKFLTSGSLGPVKLDAGAVTVGTFGTIGAIVPALRSAGLGSCCTDLFGLSDGAEVDDGLTS